MSRLANAIISEGSRGSHDLRAVVGNGTSAPVARTRGRRIETLRPPRTTSLGTVPVREALTFGLMLIAGTADRRPILFQHRGEDLQARCHRELQQLRPRIHEQINERKMALAW